jgi:iron complex transport system substrate-binding protein
VLQRHPWWQELQAVQHGKVVFADGNLFFNRSGMTVSQTAEIIAEILHGISFGERTEGIHWRRSVRNAERDVVWMGASRI